MPEVVGGEAPVPLVNEPSQGTPRLEEVGVHGSWLRIWGPIAALVAFQVVVALVCLLMMSGPPRNDFVAGLVIGIVFSQGSLLGVWAALGGKPAPWRLAGVTVMLVCLMWFLEERSGPPDERAWAFIVFVQLLGTAAPVWLARFLGLSVAMAADKPEPLESYRSQFTLWSMLEWTAGAAVFLGMMQMVPKEFWRPFADWQDFALALGLVSVEGFLSLAVLWLCLGARWTGARFAAVGLGAAAMLLVFLVSLPGQADASVIVFVFLQTNVGWLAGSLVVFRFCGFRLIWRRAVRL